MSTQTQPRPNTTAVVRPAASKPPGPTIRQRLEGPEFRKAIAAVLPKHMTPDRFLRVAILATTKTPDLANCDQASFFGALLTLSQMGLEPDGRRAHLIPFRNKKRNVVECQLIIDWKGLAELAMRSGLVANLHADVVSEGDDFAYSAGKIRVHVPWFLRRDTARPAEPGEVYAVYAVAEFRDGSTKAEVLSMAEVESIRARSKAAASGPWVTDFYEMAKKTAFRRLAKWLPLSPEFRDAVDADDELPRANATVTTPAVQMREADAAGAFVLPEPSHDPEPEAEPSEPSAPVTPDDHDNAVDATQAPAAPQQAAPPQTPEAAERRHLAVLRRKLEREGLNEAQAIVAIHRMFPDAQGCNTLDEVEHLFPNVINAVVRGSGSFVATVRAQVTEGGAK